MVELRADELLLREPTEADAVAVAGAVRASRSELAPWMPWATPEYGVEMARQWIRGETGDPHRFVMIADDGQLIGSCGLNRVDHVNRSANLGYWVRTDRVGRGHGSDAARLVAGHGLNDLGFHRLEIAMSVRNEPSRRVAEKAGAHHEGVLRGALKLVDGFHDAHLFSFVAGDL